VAVVGLGYVGLPLALAFSRHYPTLAFDINPTRIAELRRGHDRSGEVGASELASPPLPTFTDRREDLRSANTFVVAVPTPVDETKRPDLELFRSASAIVGEALSPGALVVYESTVYPGATEEVARPILERVSGLRAGRDFDLGYSPERVNPGDRVHTLATVVKIVAGADPRAADRVCTLYASIVPSGLHRASSIRVAEAAKVVENTQRDLNIALVNELAVIFERLGLDTLDVLEAAGTKWNFLPFRPGLVGGHCIGVDPYYLTYKAETVGYRPEVILAGRRVNDGMGLYVAQRVVRLLARRGLLRPHARALVLGATFKENCPDLRNSRVAELVEELEAHGLAVDLHDPCAPEDDLRGHYGRGSVVLGESGPYTALVLAVAHDAYRALDAAQVRSWLEPEHVVFDVKGVLPRALVDDRL
jgi:UDP-N-acetyl-D-galactosamine dehydrogenase